MHIAAWLATLDADVGIDPGPRAWGGDDDAARLLIQAAAVDAFDAAVAALDAGADPDAAGILGAGTPLLLAAARGHAAIVDLLVARGARIDVGRDGDAVTARDPATGAVVTVPIWTPDAAAGIAAAGGHDAIVAALDRAAGTRRG